ncbi:hypothetical protein MUY14_14385 [Amycolatopsis sp. FBCC-B4732]|uniref:hypothetical protein n=1 Tax=Amycolatopsis sp. FBCC-B4732 TaxID=3079339 RepID=UPI001FF5FB3C|nr:hypothetical protein [Amycolatopsis sp. FBCC-B4732]UOX91754.1 hypothetical protein MUY14_14385 [Amycolatopsis sp. FBCC-B4732]
MLELGDVVRGRVGAGGEREDVDRWLSEGDPSPPDISGAIDGGMSGVEVLPHRCTTARS